MSNDLIEFERQLRPLTPSFAQVLGTVMPVERLMRTIVVSAERNPDLLTKCNRQSLFNAAMTFAVLGLEVDGVTGQGFLVPFAGVVQPVIGYLGYNTLAARAGMTVTGRVVREGDGLEFDEATGVVHHCRKLGGEAGPEKRRIVGAWARAAALDRPPVLRVLSIDELLAVKAKSPRGQKPPWADEEIGFPAMCEKTAKRRLRRDMPLNVYQKAARMEEVFEEQGRPSWIHPDKGVMYGDTGVGDAPVGSEARAPFGTDCISPTYNDVTPSAQELLSPPSLEDEARMAAEHGSEIFKTFCRRLTKPQYAKMKPYLESLRPIVEAADQ